MSGGELWTGKSHLLHVDGGFRIAVFDGRELDREQILQLQRFRAHWTAHHVILQRERQIVSPETIFNGKKFSTKRFISSVCVCLTKLKHFLFTYVQSVPNMMTECHLLWKWFQQCNIWLTLQARSNWQCYKEAWSGSGNASTAQLVWITIETQHE